ncbi:MAG TPA: thioredoxin family protein [Patescibacteria group bacterium]|nr:thioredoxin family protein [Patescibacteria group bacterium]
MATPATTQPATDQNNGQSGVKTPQPQTIVSGSSATAETPVIDSDIASKKQQDLLELARKKKLLDEEAIKKLSASDRQWLNGLKAAENTSGAVTVFGADGKPVAHVTDQCIGIALEGGSGSDHDIQVTLQSAVLAKAKFGDTEQHVSANSEMNLLMMAKAAELSGLKIDNAPKAGETLNDKYPEVAKRMEQQWAAMHGQKPAAGFDDAPVPEIKAKDLADAVKSGKPLLLEVTSENCQWCEKEKPEIARIAAQTGGKVQVAKIDINELNDYISHLDDKDPLKKKLSDILHNERDPFGVPAVAVFENGNMKNMKSGYQTADQIRQFANGNLSADNALPAPSTSASVSSSPRLNNGG